MFFSFNVIIITVIICDVMFQLFMYFLLLKYFAFNFNLTENSFIYWGTFELVRWFITVARNLRMFVEQIKHRNNLKSYSLHLKFEVKKTMICGYIDSIRRSDKTLQPQIYLTGNIKLRSFRYSRTIDCLNSLLKIVINWKNTAYIKYIKNLKIILSTFKSEKKS